MLIPIKNILGCWGLGLLCIFGKGDCYSTQYYEYKNYDLSFESWLSWARCHCPELPWCPFWSCHTSLQNPFLGSLFLRGGMETFFSAVPVSFYSSQGWVHGGLQTFDVWLQMVMDFASCGTSCITCLHHRMTSEHMVSRLEWPSCRLGPQGQQCELAKVFHLSHASLVLTAGNFNKDINSQSETLGTPIHCPEHYLSSSGHK